MMNSSETTTVLRKANAESAADVVPNIETVDAIGIKGLLAVPIWAGLVALPLAMTVGGMVENFPEEWRQNAWGPAEWPGPLGLCLGLAAVAVGKVFLLAYHFLHLSGYFGKITPIQSKGAPDYNYLEGVVTHLSQPEGFVLLGSYLAGTWMFNLMPAAYYSFEGEIVVWQVFAQLLLQDAVQYGMHMLEHSLSTEFYKLSHKPHHRFTNPRLFDAFNGSLADTFLMILVPLYVTANVISCNVWTYMAFGSLYANWLTLIHSEYPHPWDPLFRKLGFGTAADHHVHHKLFKYNYGHLFMYWDMAAGTYKDPSTVKYFNVGV